MARFDPRGRERRAAALHALVRIIRPPTRRDVDPTQDMSSAVVQAEVEQVLRDHTGSVRRGMQIQFRTWFQATEPAPTLGGDEELLLSFWRGATHAEVFLDPGDAGGGVWREADCYLRRVASDKTTRSHAWRQRKAAPRHKKHRAEDADDDADTP